MPIIYSLIYWNELLIQKECGNLDFFSLFFSKVARAALFWISEKFFTIDFFCFLENFHRNFSEIWSNLETIPWWLSQPKGKYSPLKPKHTSKSNLINPNFFLFCRWDNNIWPSRKNRSKHVIIFDQEKRL